MPNCFVCKSEKQIVKISGTGIPHSSKNPLKTLPKIWNELKCVNCFMKDHPGIKV